jgi:pyruvate dehydrogenase E1 component beta subunit
MRRDPTVFIMGLGVGERGGSYLVTTGLLEEFGALRVIDTPIAEASFTGMGVGAAIVGLRPVVEILFADFALLAMDQLVNQAAKYRFMTAGRGTVPMVVRTQGGVGHGLAAQHSQSLEALFYHIPGLHLVAPSTPQGAKGLLKSAIRCDDPVIFMEHKMLYATEGEIPDDDYVIELGKGEIRRSGSDLTLIAWSNMVPRSLAAAAALSAEGIEVEVIDPITLVPLDTALILMSVRRTGRAVIVQEAARRGGVASDIASIIQQEAFGDLNAPVKIIAGRNTPIPFNCDLERACIPQEADIVREVRQMMPGGGE